MVRVDDYAHHVGRHCGSTSLRNLAGHYGWGYDEETCFGLAAGLGFTYFEVDESPHRGFFGRPPRLEPAFFDRLAIDVDRHEGGDWETTLERIRTAVAAGDPALVFTDIYYLDYFGTDTHFAPHALLCVGIDEEAETALLSDSEFDELQEVSLERLRAAMASDHVLPLRNRHIVVADPEPDRTLADAAPEAIAEMAGTMLEPNDQDRDTGFGTQGIEGIRRLAEDLPSWVDLENPRWTVRFAYQNVERRGTGGGAFRRLYADFLERAADAVPALPDDAPSRMHDIAADWTAVGETLAEASERADPEAMRPALVDAGESIRDLADREERLYGELRAELA
ncbi:BtrH N-terminal domain-containing protein [Natronococcus wangiae]|uniref:BtrH N-terminal domain-containing protein n=1 Tax=Natronococcus wangiae TaxID=3068275 RepID=UPI00273D0959|nr:BtrH N-terminal domain-containing protein [Natronococcus sp. AD5]